MNLSVYLRKRRTKGSEGLMDLTALFKTMLSLSFMGSVLAVVIILTKRIFKNKLSANWHYYIWFLLIIRLIIPYAPVSSLSMFNLLSPASQRIEISQNSNGSIDANTPLSHINDKSTSNKDNIASNSNVENGSTDKENIVIQKKNTVGFNYYMISVIWLIGVIIMLLHLLIVNMKFLVNVNKRLECKEEDIIRNFAECKSKMNVYANIPIVYDDNLNTPALFGVIRPRLLMPHKIINILSEEEKGYIFLHELAHLKRKDILINWIMVIAQALHWFNPIVWYAFYKMHQDCEVACDAYVLSRLNPVEHKKYGETIINLINKISKSYWNPVATGMANDRSGIKRRIEMIAMFKKNTWKWSAIAVVLLIGISIIGLTGAKGTANVNNKDGTNILSKNTIDFNKDSDNENLIVKMTDGRYYEDTNPGPYMGANWEGKFNIQLINDKGNVISKLDLNKVFNEQELNFQGDFNVEFDDYNNDGNIDFTIGQYASSNGNTYKLFTILPDGKIEPLIIKGQSEIFSSGGNRYSIKFEKIGEATFKNQYYDNSKGETVETYYSWSNNENQFIIKPIDGPIGEEMGKDYAFGSEVGQSAINQDSSLYTNTQYGFSFSLPDSWKGYSIVNGKWEGISLGDQNGGIVTETGPLLSIRHPLWTGENPRQDIPVMVFTLDQWSSLQQGKFHIGAAPIGPSELGRNSRYVFALPARYNYAFLQGFEEVENILNGKPLHITQ